MENCRRLGINPKEYLTDVLTRLPGMLASEAASLIPANWLKARSGKSVRKEQAGSGVWTCSAATVKAGARCGNTARLDQCGGGSE